VRLVRVLLEILFVIALKFLSRREYARVVVGKDVENGVDVFFVKDNGAGFDLAAANKLFTAFQRYHRPTEFDGTGIGLATAQRIVARHGGRIWAESAPDRGASFHFILDRGDTK
jgi:light-regulated signal transduction histidine kinase (bacteriophytochrome)